MAYESFASAYFSNISALYSKLRSSFSKNNISACCLISWSSSFLFDSISCSCSILLFFSFYFQFLLCLLLSFALFHSFLLVQVLLSFGEGWSCTIQHRSSNNYINDRAISMATNGILDLPHTIYFVSDMLARSDVSMRLLTEKTEMRQNFDEIVLNRLWLPFPDLHISHVTSHFQQNTGKYKKKIKYRTIQDRKKYWTIQEIQDRWEHCGLFPVRCL